MPELTVWPWIVLILCVLGATLVGRLYMRRRPQRLALLGPWPRILPPEIWP